MRPITAAAVLAAVSLAWPASAQTPAVLADSGSPFGPAVLTQAEQAAIAMPSLAFDAATVDAGEFEKYFYFRRADTDVATAYADISECDGYARGLRSGVGTMSAPYPYAATLAGAAGAAIGNAMAAAIFGSAEKRRLRRLNMRTCMHFKGYARHGLAKPQWEAFHFEEGFGSADPETRQRCLRQQALVAAIATPQGAELGL